MRARRNDSVADIWIGGDLDHGARDVVETTIASLADARLGSPTGIRFHMAHVTFVDSTGITVLVSALNLICGAGGQVIVEDPPAMLIRLLEIAGLTDDIVVQVDLGGWPAMAPSWRREHASQGCSVG